jgi:hypothetical protein
VTWTKLGDEYSDELAQADISDAAYRTHTEAIGWLYRVERPDLQIPKRLVRRFAGSPEYETAIKELITRGLWADRDDHYEVLHHATVIRQSIAAQQAKRESDRQRQARHRAKRPDATPDVTRDGTPEVTGYTDRQTDSYPRSAE